MTKKLACYPPTVVLEDLSSLEDVSTCSSTSTITCSVWSSISNLDRSSLRQISSLTFSGMLDDDEYYLGGGVEEDKGAKTVQAYYSAPEARRSSKSIDRVFGINSSKTAVDSLISSERSLFQEPLSPIPRNEAPKAPARLQDDGSKITKKKEDDLTPSRPLFTKSSSCPTRFGQGFCTSTTTTSGNAGPRAMNKTLSLRGVDSTPKIPSRSRNDGNDDSGGLSCDNCSHEDDKLVEERTPRARRKQLMKRIEHVQRMLTNNADCNVLRGGVSLNRAHEEPPKLPRRGLFIDTPSRDRPSIVASSPTTSDHHFHSAFHKKPEAKKDVTKSDNGSHAKASNYSSFDISPRRLASKFPLKKPRRKHRTTKTTDQHGCEGTTSTKPIVNDPKREAPTLLLAKVSKSERGLLPSRPRSKTPPKRFATAPAVMCDNTDVEKYPIVPKRLIKRNRSSEHHRRRGQVLSNSSLASILESDDENWIASPMNSPQQRRPRRPSAAPVSCPSRIGIMEASETSKKDKVVRSSTGGMASKFLNRPQRSAEEHSWLGSGSRSLLQ